MDCVQEAKKTAAYISTQITKQAYGSNRCVALL